MRRMARIMVVDDDRSSRELLKMMLVREGYELLFAEDGKEAVEKAAAEKPDLVLMDGLLPKLHGFLACKAIKDLPDAPKVILVTGVYTKPTYKSEATRLYRADDLLLKPLSLTELLSSIDKHTSNLEFRDCARPSESESAEACERSEQPVTAAFAFRPVEADEMLNSLRLASET